MKFNAISDGYFRYKREYKGEPLVSILFHRYIYEKFVGPIPTGYLIHHKNGNPYDNRIENLEPISKTQHTILHHTGSHRSEETKKKLRKSSRKRWDKYR